jgi:hypothetical protein
MLIIHLVAVLLVPRHWPLVLSMFTTRISRKFVQQHHATWEKDLIAREQATSSAPRPAPPVSSNVIGEVKQ